MSIQKPKYIFLRMALVFILVGVFIWSYALFKQNYEKVQLSHKMVEALLENETALAKQYAGQLGLMQENLDRTETFLKDIKAENMKLKEKIKLLDQLNDMQQELGRLRNENQEIQEQMLRVSAQDQSGFAFKTIEKGKSLIRDLRKKLRGVRERIHFIKKENAKKKIAAQEEVDRNESLLGNNGYLIKDGQLMPMDMPDVTTTVGGPKVNVKFLK